MRCPASAKAPSISPATDESSPENTSFGARPGAACSTVSFATSSGSRRRQTPRGRVAIGLALRALAGAEPRDLEPRMRREQRDELLADHAGRAEDADFNLSHDCSFPSWTLLNAFVSFVIKKKADAVASAEYRLVDSTVLLAFEHNSPDAAGPLSRVASSLLLRAVCARAAAA